MSPNKYNHTPLKRNPTHNQPEKQTSKQRTGLASAPAPRLAISSPIKIERDINTAFKGEYER